MTSRQRRKARAARQFQFENAHRTDEQLTATFDWIGSQPEHRVKATGHVKHRWADFGDVILGELRRRRIEREGVAA